MHLKHLNNERNDWLAESKRSEVSGFRQGSPGGSGCHRNPALSSGIPWALLCCTCQAVPSQVGCPHYVTSSCPYSPEEEPSAFAPEISATVLRL